MNHPHAHRRAHRPRFWDALFVGVLGLYVLAGVRAAPFHGDESTIIFMSRDIAALNPAHLERLLYRDPPSGDPAAQELRLLNGSLTTFGIGALWTLAGFTPLHTNEQWDWGADYAYNLSAGHMPSAPIGFVSRLWSAFAALISTAALFALARRLLGRHGAWLVAACYVTLPSLLLNTRRANFEGSVQLTLTLFLLIVVIVARRLEAGRGRWQHWAWVGIAAGACLSAKHNLLLVIMPTLMTLLLVQAYCHRQWLAMLRPALIVSVATSLCFVLFNPAWWSADVRLPSAVISLRLRLVEEQASAFGSFQSVAQRLEAALTAVIAPPQYYEVPTGWPGWLAAPINDYEAATVAGAPLRGIAWPVVSLLLALLGFITLPGGAAALILRISGSATLLGMVLLNPLPWQRYYLPLAPFWALCFGAGAAYLIAAMWRRSEVWRVRRT
jgi:4-amino-4-deoxy-L-arabinose transferase-like glycosyltransferase